MNRIIKKRQFNSWIFKVIYQNMIINPELDSSPFAYEHIQTFKKLKDAREFCKKEYGTKFQDLNY